LVRACNALSGSATNRVAPPDRQNLAEPKFNWTDDGLNEWTNRYRIRRDSWRYSIHYCSCRLVMVIHKLFASLEKLLSHILLVYAMSAKVLGYS
jgi:hypothetical protein